MIPIQLETGKTVFISLEDWLNMTPEKYQDLIANNEGYDIDNPFDKLLDKVRDYDKNYNLNIPDLPENLNDIDEP